VSVVLADKLGPAGIVTRLAGAFAACGVPVEDLLAAAADVEVLPARPTGFMTETAGLPEEEPEPPGRLGSFSVVALVLAAHGCLGVACFFRRKHRTAEALEDLILAAETSLGATQIGADAEPEDVWVWPGQPGRWWSEDQQKIFDVKVQEVDWASMEVKVQFCKNPEYWKWAPLSQIGVRLQLADPGVSTGDIGEDRIKVDNVETPFRRLRVLSPMPTSPARGARVIDTGDSDNPGGMRIPGTPNHTLSSPDARTPNMKSGSPFLPRDAPTAGVQVNAMGVPISGSRDFSKASS
jgi:hypothetical protein